MKHDENHSHVIWKVTTSFEGAQTSSHKEPGYLETGCSVLNLHPFTPFIRCTYCQSLTHTKKDCWAEYSSCVFCAGHHLSSECTNKTRFTCANCFGPHKASDPICSQIRVAMEKQCPPLLPKLKSQGKAKTNQAKSVPKSPEPVKYSSTQVLDSQRIPLKPVQPQTSGKDTGLQSPTPPNPCPTTRVPSLFETKFTSHQVEQLFPPATYHRISQKLFPSLVPHPWSDKTWLPVVALLPQAIAEPITNATQTPLTQKATQLSPTPYRTPSSARHSNANIEPLTASFRTLSPHLSYQGSHRQTLGPRYPIRLQCRSNRPHPTQLPCPKVGHFPNVPQFLIPFISHLHDILRRDTKCVKPQ